VHVDEAGTDEQSAGVDYSPRRFVNLTDRCDSVAGDRHVGRERGLAGAVDHTAAADEQVEHES
jgi:hypothetical protein